LKYVSGDFTIWLHGREGARVSRIFAHNINTMQFDAYILL
jgi:hypothetical protein